MRPMSDMAPQGIGSDHRDPQRRDWGLLAIVLTIFLLGGFAMLAFFMGRLPLPSP